MPPECQKSLVLTDEAATDRLGGQIAALLQPGDVLALVGDLGAGKTRLSKAIALALGADAGSINSPTFTLIQEYPASLTIRHCDVYRLRDPSEFADLGLDELFDEQGVAIVEWADRVTEYLPRERLELQLVASGANERTLTLLGWGSRGAALVQQLSRSP